MKEVALLLFLLIFLNAQTNSTIVNKNIEANISKSEKNISKDENLSQEELTKKAIEEQIKREDKYRKEQKFYMGDEYNLDVHKVDKKSLKHIKPIEPEYDFDMDDVYD